jgi:predicted membrane protein
MPSDAGNLYYIIFVLYNILVVIVKATEKKWTKSFVFSQNGQADDEEINDNSIQKKQHIANKKKTVATVEKTGNIHNNIGKYK